MGTDIHGFIEYRKLLPNDQQLNEGCRHAWRSVTSGEFYIGRDYNLFGYMAGLRNELGEPLFPRRELPDASSYSWPIQLKLFDRVDSESCEEQAKCNYEHRYSYISEEEAKDVAGKYFAGRDITKYAIFEDGYKADLDKMIYFFGIDNHTLTILNSDELVVILNQPFQIVKTVRNKNYEKDEYIDMKVSYEVDPVMHAIVATMKELEFRGYETRFVCWFDN